VGQIEVGLEVARTPRKLLVGGNMLLGLLALPKDLLRLLGILPEVGLGSFLL